MQLASGSRLGPYEIIALIGAGGMGEVYRGRDTRLNRSVAIKIISPIIGKDQVNRERFEREAQTISQLNHPHICALYDVGRADGVDYLVMEYLEGETLSARLRRGPLPVSLAIRYAIEIAQALDAAHRHGIIHRDLKPANVILTKSGAKLVDFGLVKFIPAAAGVFSETPIADRSLTDEGAILGTVQYMSPEQVEGKQLDARSDIFSFGAVLYEMVTGKRAFEGKSRASVIAAILDSDPPAPSSLTTTSPSELDRVISACLAKDPDERWQTAHDLMMEIQWLASSASQTGASSRHPSHRSRRVNAMWAAVLVATVAATVYVTTRLQPTSKDRVSLRFSVPLVQAKEADTLAISPDGLTLAYFQALPNSGLVLKRLDQNAERMIAGTEGGILPFFSPDGESIGFFTPRKLKKLSVETGVVSDICDAATGRGASWSDDGTIYFNPLQYLGIWKVSANGGKAEPVTVLNAARGENSHRFPQLLPGGKDLLMTVRTDALFTFDDATIGVLSLETRKFHPVLQGAGYARYIPSGALLFSRAGTLFSIPFDLASKKTTGTAIRIVDGVRTHPNNGYGAFAISNTGVLVYQPGDGSGYRKQLLWVNRSGEARPATTREALYDLPAISPDGNRIVTGLGAANDNIGILDLERDTLTRVSFEPGDNLRPMWLPDGRRVIYSCSASRGRFLVMRDVETGSAQRLLSWPDQVFATSVSADGNVLGIWTLGTSDYDSYTVRLDQKPIRPVAIANTPFAEMGTAVSPDGQWVAYSSNESGQPEIYVQRIDGGRWQVSTGGGMQPKWSANGTELFYREKDKLYVLDVRIASKSPFGKPRLLFEKPYFACRNYDVAPNGQEFLMCTDGVTNVRPPQINVVTNFFDVVKRSIH